MSRKSDYELFSDSTLLGLLKSGDVQAFTEIYERYETLLYLYAYRKLQNKEDAKDVIQDVYTTLWDSRNSIVILNTLSGYLYKAVLNRALNIYKHKKLDQSHIDSFMSIIQTTAETTDYLIREKDISALIDYEVSMLPNRMGEIFNMRRKMELSDKEIALQLGISVHTVKTQMKQALKILRGKFGLLIYIAWWFRW